MAASVVPEGDPAAEADPAQGSPNLPLGDAEFCLKIGHAQQSGPRRNSGDSQVFSIGLDLAPHFWPAQRRAFEKEGAMNLVKGMCRAVIAAGALAAGVGAADAQTQGTIKIGVLHSLSGTMAISETTLKDTILMMVD